MKRLQSLVVFSGLLLLATGSAFAGNGDADRRGFSGTVACGGNHFNRLGGTEAHRTTFVLRNYNQNDSIYINRIRMHNATGAIIFDSNVSGLPVFFNNVLGVSDNTLDPNQTAHLRSQDILGEGGLASTDRPIQTLFDWSADRKILTPDVAHVRTGRARIQTSVDSSGNPIWKTREDRARHMYECRQIFTADGKGQK